MTFIPRLLKIEQKRDESRFGANVSFRLPNRIDDIDEWAAWAQGVQAKRLKQQEATTNKGA